MFAPKAALFALAAAAVSATPLVRRADTVSCGSSTGGNIPLGPVKQQIKDAPSEASNHGHAYPHKFYNYEHLELNDACQGQTMLELPVFSDGHAYDLEHGENPGAARAIYSADSHDLCAVVAHNNGNSDFHECN